MEKEPLRKSIAAVVPKTLQISGAIFFIAIILIIIFWRSCNPSATSIVDVIGNGEELTSSDYIEQSKAIIEDKIKRIQELKKLGALDKETIKKLETEVEYLKTTLETIENEVDNMNPSSTIEVQNTKKKVLEITRKSADWSEETDKQIAMISGTKVKSIRDSLSNIDANYLKKLDEKDKEIARLRREIETMKFERNDNQEITRLKAKISELEQEITRLRIDNERLQRENDEMRIATAESSGDKALVKELKAELSTRNNETKKITELENRLGKFENIVDKLGGLDIHYIDNQGRRIELLDKDIKARDIHAMKINFRKANIDDCEVEIKFIGSQGSETPQGLQKTAYIRDFSFDEPVIIKGEKKKMLPKGNYCVTLVRKNTNEEIAKKCFKVLKTF